MRILSSHLVFLRPRYNANKIEEYIKYSEVENMLEFDPGACWRSSVTLLISSLEILNVRYGRNDTADAVFLPTEPRKANS